VQRSGTGAARRVCAATGAARLCSGRRPPLGGRTRLVTGKKLLTSNMSIHSVVAACDSYLQRSILISPVIIHATLCLLMLQRLLSSIVANS